MNTERYINKKQEEADKTDEAVDEYYERPRTDKSRSADDVAHEVIKDGDNRPISLEQIPLEERQWYENMRDAGIRVLDGGFLEISRWDNTGKNFAKPKLMRQKIDGINSAIRMQDHILYGYRSEGESHSSEYSKIESIEEVIEWANELLNRWDTAKQEDKKDLQRQLADVVLQLERCRNEFKVEAKEQAAAVMELKDSRGRENPSALAARTVAALNNLSKRINEMHEIMPQMALRKEVLLLEKRRVEGVLRKADARLSGVLHHAVFSKNAKKSPESRIKDYEVTELDSKIGQALHLLGTVYVAPYFQQAEQAKFSLLSKTKKSFRSKNMLLANLDFVREALVETQIILRSDVSHFG